MRHRLREQVGRDLPAGHGFLMKPFRLLDEILLLHAVRGRQKGHASVNEPTQCPSVPSEEGAHGLLKQLGGQVIPRYDVLSLGVVARCLLTGLAEKEWARTR